MANMTDYRGLSGPQKAAILMLSMEESSSAKIWELLDDEEIKELSQTMSALGTISTDVIEKLTSEFVGKISAGASVIGNFDTTERLLMKVLPNDRVDIIMEEIRGPAGRTMWDKLANVNESILGSYLKNEYPQTVAVVLSKISPSHAARVLTELPEDFTLEVISRMLRMETVQKEIIDKIEETLRVEFMSNLARTNRRDPHEMMAEIFNNLDRASETRFTAALEERNREAAERIKALMFTFEDLNKLDPAGVQTLLRVVEKEKLSISLKGASEGLRDLFFSNMSERAAKIMREDMAAMGPVRLKDVEAAQMEMVSQAKDLAAKGEIVLADGGAEDELVF